MVAIDLHGAGLPRGRSQGALLRDNFVKALDARQPGWLLGPASAAERRGDGIRCVGVIQAATGSRSSKGVGRRVPCSPPHLRFGCAERALVARHGVIGAGRAGKDTSRVWIGRARARNAM